MKKTTITLCLILTLFTNNTIGKCETGLSSYQEKMADTIARIAMEEYDTYHILPSIVVTQACNESSLGVYNQHSWNLWGMKVGGGSDEIRSYGSLYEGEIDYLHNLQDKRYYEGVTEKRNFYDQINQILNGGYCPDEGYLENCVYLYKKYNFEKYDKKLWELKKKEAEKERKRRLKIKREKRRLKKQKKVFTVKHNPSLRYSVVAIDKKIVRKGAAGIRHNGKTIMRADVVPGGKGFVIYVNDSSLDGKKVRLEVTENAKG